MSPYSIPHFKRWDKVVAGPEISVIKGSGLFDADVKDVPHDFVLKASTKNIHSSLYD